MNMKFKVMFNFLL